VSSAFAPERRPERRLEQPGLRIASVVTCVSALTCPETSPDADVFALPDQTNLPLATSTSDELAARL
jgi:hypothetical protein